MIAQRVPGAGPDQVHRHRQARLPQRVQQRPGNRPVTHIRGGRTAAPSPAGCSGGWPDGSSKSTAVPLDPAGDRQPHRQRRVQFRVPQRLPVQPVEPRRPADLEPTPVKRPLPQPAVIMGAAPPSTCPNSASPYSSICATACCSLSRSRNGNRRCSSKYHASSRSAGRIPRGAHCHLVLGRSPNPTRAANAPSSPPGTSMTLTTVTAACPRPGPHLRCQRKPRDAPPAAPPHRRAQPGREPLHEVMGGTRRHVHRQRHHHQLHQSREKASPPAADAALSEFHAATSALGPNPAPVATTFRKPGPSPTLPVNTGLFNHPPHLPRYADSQRPAIPQGIRDLALRPASIRIARNRYDTLISHGTAIANAG